MGLRAEEARSINLKISAFDDLTVWSSTAEGNKKKMNRGRRELRYWEEGEVLTIIIISIIKMRRSWIAYSFILLINFFFVYF